MTFALCFHCKSKPECAYIPVWEVSAKVDDQAGRHTHFVYSVLFVAA